MTGKVNRDVVAARKAVRLEPQASIALGAKRPTRPDLPVVPTAVGIRGG